MVSSSVTTERRNDLNSSGGTALLMDDHALVANTHGLGEGGSGLPFRRCTRRRLLHHLVDLFQRQALGLRDDEIGIDKRGSAKAAPDKENRRFKVALICVNHIGGYDGNDL